MLEEKKLSLNNELKYNDHSFISFHKVIPKKKKKKNFFILLVSFQSMHVHDVHKKFWVTFNANFELAYNIVYSSRKKKIKKVVDNL